MSSWFYLNYFPAPHEKLTPEKAIELIPDHEIIIREEVLEAEEIDELGHWEFLKDGLPLGSSPVNEIQKRLLNQEQFNIECASHDILFYCGFLLETKNPCFLICGSRRSFNDLSQERFDYYWNMMVQIAAKANAGYVLYSVDTEDVEDRFIEIDNKRVLDLDLKLESEKKYGHGIGSVWVNSNKSNATVPIGLDPTSIDELGHGFREYKIVD